MNLLSELDRITEPLPKASAVRVLTLQEIAELEAAGSITPVSEIKEWTQRHRIHTHRKHYRGRYGWHRH